MKPLHEVGSEIRRGTTRIEIMENNTTVGEYEKCGCDKCVDRMRYYAKTYPIHRFMTDKLCQKLAHNLYTHSLESKDYVVRTEHYESDYVLLDGGSLLDNPHLEGDMMTVADADTTLYFLHQIEKDTQ